MNKISLTRYSVDGKVGYVVGYDGKYGILVALSSKELKLLGAAFKLVLGKCSEKMGVPRSNEEVRIMKAKDALVVCRNIDSGKYTNEEKLDAIRALWQYTSKDLTKPMMVKIVSFLLSQLEGSHDLKRVD